MLGPSQRQKFRRTPTRHSGPPLGGGRPHRMTGSQNNVIDLLPRREGRQLAALCSRVDLHLGDLLQPAGRPPMYVYFPTGALVGLFSGSVHTMPVQLAQVGQEGMVGSKTAGAPQVAALASVVQEPGTALQTSSSDYQAEMRRSPPLYAAAKLHDALLLRQVVHSAACLHSHELGPRLARWLLSTQDRAGSRAFFATQDSLSMMLGVRRVGITRAAKALQRRGLIDYQRGHIKVLDRRGLRACSCTCYATDRVLLAASRRA